MSIKLNMREYKDANVGVRFIEPANKSASGPKRKEIRLKNYDYSQDGYYFVTICTYKQKPIMTEYKDVVERILFSLPKRFTGLNIDWFILMPTHIHVIFIFEDMKRSLSDVIRVFKALVSHELKQKIWQRNYYEHIIRNDDALCNIRKYIEENPLVDMIEFEKFYENGSDKSAPYKNIGD